MSYKFRVILDAEQDVIRDIIVDKNSTLEALHFTIAKAFGFNGQEMASFFYTDEQWEQGEEIPLCDMSDDESSIAMGSCFVSQILPIVGDKLIYVYDFYSLWTFYVNLVDTNCSENSNLPLVSFSVGTTPKEAPEKSFSAEDDDWDIFNDDSDFENYDDIDWDNY